jgi:hypothetical protein
VYSVAAVDEIDCGGVAVAVDGDAVIVVIVVVKEEELFSTISKLPFSLIKFRLSFLVVCI